MRLMMFQLSGFYCMDVGPKGPNCPAMSCPGRYPPGGQQGPPGRSHRGPPDHRVSGRGLSPRSRAPGLGV